MQYKQKSFRKIPANFLQLTDKFLIAKKLSDFAESDLARILDDFSWKDATEFLPNKNGKHSTINADGKTILRRDLPKEVIFREYKYKRLEFHGRDNRVEVDDSTWRSFERIFREQLPAPSVPIKCIVNNDEKLLMIECDSKDSEQLLLHKLNLALEVFKSEFEIHISAKDGFVKIPTKFEVVNWMILPSGEKTQEEIISLINSTISPKLKKTERPVIEKRLAKISSYPADAMAIGLGGYKGYIIYHFRQKGISVLESDNVNNATYVFDFKKWQELSQLSKTEIIEEGLAEQRIIHNQEWESNIDKLLS